MNTPILALCALLVGAVSLPAGDLPLVGKVEAQPLAAQARRVTQALEFVGAPLTPAQQTALTAALAEQEEANLVKAVQAVFDPLCLVGVNINPESRVKVAAGPARPDLVEAGWTVFLIRIHNEAGVTAALRVQSPNARSMHNSPKAELANRWLDLATFACCA